MPVKSHTRAFYTSASSGLRTPAFATHLLEAGVDLYSIGRLLGHGHLSTTSRYLHLARSKLTGNPSPLDLLDPPS
jgi:site-specific recombinase XerD